MIKKILLTILVSTGFSLLGFTFLLLEAKFRQVEASDNKSTKIPTKIYRIEGEFITSVAITCLEGYRFIVYERHNLQPFPNHNNQQKCVQ